VLSGLKNAWRTGKLELPLGKAWFRVIGRAVEPVTWEGWGAFYVIFTWIIGGAYYLAPDGTRWVCRSTCRFSSLSDFLCFAL